MCNLVQVRSSGPDNIEKLQLTGLWGLFQAFTGVSFAIIGFFSQTVKTF